ncbi:hypothetical protein HB780_26605 [Rhizobium lusitanum]|uniref:hypothetical protein n=1 Tax=Rhizobium lusitanum TaxID=293958 RepID=UPI001613A2D9|nr:hypothetical protein [Rhizobium lusitanum]QND49103.1 hypothetical protein HB780_26605 [Rhizobium lusitanum]
MLSNAFLISPAQYGYPECKKARGAGYCLSQLFFLEDLVLLSGFAAVAVACDALVLLRVAASRTGISDCIKHQKARWFYQAALFG